MPSISTNRSASPEVETAAFLSEEEPLGRRVGSRSSGAMPIVQPVGAGRRVADDDVAGAGDQGRGDPLALRGRRSPRREAYPLAIAAEVELHPGLRAAGRSGPSGRASSGRSRPGPGPWRAARGRAASGRGGPVARAGPTGPIVTSKAPPDRSDIACERSRTSNRSSLTGDGRAAGPVAEPHQLALGVVVAEGRVEGGDPVEGGAGGASGGRPRRWCIKQS